jgi:hypothetical protein
MKERNHRSVLSHSSSLSTNSTDKQSNGSTSSTLTNDTGSSRIIVLNSCVILVTVVVPNKEWLVLKRFPFDGTLLVELSHDPGDKSDTERKMLTLSWGSEHPSTTVTNVTFTSAETALEVCEAIEDGIEGEKNVAKQQALNNMQRRFDGSNKVSWSTYYNSDAEDNLNEDVEEDAKNIEEDVETKNDKKKKPPIKYATS